MPAVAVSGSVSRGLVLFGAGRGLSAGDCRADGLRVCRAWAVAVLTVGGQSIGIGAEDQGRRAMVTIPAGIG